MQNTDLKELLNYIDPSGLNYQEWVNVGMSLHYEGYSVADWDEWSAKDSGRYHPGDVYKRQSCTNLDFFKLCFGAYWTSFFSFFWSLI